MIWCTPKGFFLLSELFRHPGAKASGLHNLTNTPSPATGPGRPPSPGPVFMDILVRIRNQTSTIEAELPVLAAVNKALRAEIPGTQFIRGYRGDGYWNPVNLRSGSVPTGLLSRLRKQFPLAKFIDERERPAAKTFNPDIIPGVTLDGVQSRSLQKFLSGWGRGIIALAPGAGKTELGIAMGLHVPGKWIWICHRKSLLHQTAERIRDRTGLVSAKIGDGFFDEVERQKFVIAMPQTATKDPDLFKAYTKGAVGLIIDEAHTASASIKWFRFSQMVPAYWRAGLTATPVTGNPDKDARIEAATGPILIRIKSGSLAGIGKRIVPCIVVYHKVGPPHSDEIAKVAGEVNWAILRKVFIEGHDVRNQKIVTLACAAAYEGKKVLIICDTVRHASILAELLSCEDVRYTKLTGKASTAQRSQAVKEMRHGSTQIILTTPIFDEGINVPELDTLILAAGGKSGVKVVQRIGRILRKYSGKGEATVHDFMDTGSRIVQRHWASRVLACKQEGFRLAEAKL